MKAVYKALAAIAIVPIGWTSTAAAQPNEKQKAFVENSLSRLIEAYWLLVLLMHNDPRRPIFYTFAALLGCRDRRTVRLGRAPANTNNTAGAAIRR